MDHSDRQQPTQRSEGGADEYFKKAPWLSQKGKTSGQMPKPHKGRMEKHIQEATDYGSLIVQFWLGLASGLPFPMKRVVELPMTPEQLAVARGTATPEERKIAKKQRRFIVETRLYVPTIKEAMEAMRWLTDRGFGTAPQTVQIEGSQTSGFKMILRHWAPGSDPAMEELQKNVAGPVNAKGTGIAEARAQQKPGQNSTNGHKNGN